MSDEVRKKRAQFELTRDVRLAVTSRARKMSRMEEMRTMYGHVRSHVAMNCLNAAEDRHLTSSLRHPKILIKEFSYFLMPCHQHGLRINLLV